MTELELFTEPMPAAQPLPARQDAVMRAVHRLNGIAADEAGAIVHALRPADHRYRHSEEERCNYCGLDGKSVLKALAKKKLVTRRRDGYWTAPGPVAKREHERARADAVEPPAPPARSCSGSATNTYNQFPAGY